MIVIATKVARGIGKENCPIPKWFTVEKIPGLDFDVENSTENETQYCEKKEWSVDCLNVLFIFFILL